MKFEKINTTIFILMSTACIAQNCIQRDCKSFYAPISQDSINKENLHLHSLSSYAGVSDSFSFTETKCYLNDSITTYEYHIHLRLGKKDTSLLMLKGQYINGLLTGKQMEISIANDTTEVYFHKGLFHGLFKIHDIIGRTIMEEMYKNGLKHGRSWYIDPVFRVKHTQYFENGLQENYEIFDNHGTITGYMPYRKGKKEGIGFYWLNNGTITECIQYKNDKRYGTSCLFDTGKLTKMSIYDKKGNSVIYENNTKYRWIRSDKNPTRTPPQKAKMPNAKKCPCMKN